jgi:hypothetical protein
VQQAKEIPMKNHPFGLYSSVVAALVWLGSCGGVIAVQQNQLLFFNHDLGLLALQCGFFTAPGMALLGVVLAIGGLMQADRKKVFAVLGLIFNGLVLLGVLGVFCLIRG